MTRNWYLEEEAIEEAREFASLFDRLQNEGYLVNRSQQGAYIVRGEWLTRCCTDLESLRGFAIEFGVIGKNRQKSEIT